MTNFEMVEMLREKANVSYEQAKQALEDCNWDLLDAMVLLEKQGATMKSTADYTTRTEGDSSNGEKAEKERSNFGEGLHQIGVWLRKLIRIGCDNSLVINHKGHEILSFPVILPVVLLIPCFWLMIIALVVGLFCGVRYSFRGPNLGKDKINEVIGRVSDAAEVVKEDLRKQKEKATGAENKYDDEAPKNDNE